MGLLSRVWYLDRVSPWFRGAPAWGRRYRLPCSRSGAGIQSAPQRSFSYLYLSNVLGAVVGATFPLLLIELYGFRGTLKIGAACNAALALSAVLLSLGRTEPEPTGAPKAAAVAGSVAGYLSSGTNRPLVLLFLTGLTSIGMEVVWIRQFTPYVGTVVYAFASILATYLVSTFIGLQIYRLWSRKNRREGNLIWVLLGLFALLPLLAANPGIHVSRMLRLDRGHRSIFRRPGIPHSPAGGSLVGRRSGQGRKSLCRERSRLHPGTASLRLPAFAPDKRALGIVRVLAALAPDGGPPGWAFRRNASIGRQVFPTPWCCSALALVFTQKSYEDQFGHSEVLRDNTATIVAMGEGRNKHLLVNGVGITGLTPITKFMAHLPLAFLDHPPKNALVVCFGMGTTYRSLLSWDIPVTAVELVPSVPRVFGYFHADGPALLRSPLSHVVIDDGRRYLERTSEQYDVITIDPPPPVQAAGSSLLYSKEFYAIINRRLRPGGILQQWLPGETPLSGPRWRAP